MDIAKCVLKDCLFPYNDVASCHKGKIDIEVSFPNIIVSFRHTFLHDTMKINVKFKNYSERLHAEHLASLIAKMNCVVDSPQVVVDTCGVALHIDFMVMKSTSYIMAQLLLYFIRYPISEDHDENIL